MIEDVHFLPTSHHITRITQHHIPCQRACARRWNAQRPTRDLQHGGTRRGANHAWGRSLVLTHVAKHVERTVLCHGQTLIMSPTWRRAAPYRTSRSLARRPTRDLRHGGTRRGANHARAQRLSSSAVRDHYRPYRAITNTACEVAIHTEAS